MHAKFALSGLVFAAALLAASCGGSSNTDGADGMAGMDHGSMNMGSEDMAAKMVMKNGEYSDERFIDAMVPHHQGAVDMAEVALDEAEHPEIKRLAKDIIASQQAEIEQMKDIKQREFGTSKVPMEMSSQEMEMMGMMMDPGQLAKMQPFDKAFIDAMIPHHQSAVAMAEVALEESENEEIRALAKDIIEAQRREIEQMQSWREEWFTRG